MILTTRFSKRTELNSSSADRFEKWIQAPVTHYDFNHVGEDWKFHLIRQSVTSSTGSANTTPSSTSELLQNLAVVVEDRQLIADWLSFTEDTFDFWNNDLDAAYDNL